MSTDTLVADLWSAHSHRCGPAEPTDKGSAWIGGRCRPLEMTDGLPLFIEHALHWLNVKKIQQGVYSAPLPQGLTLHHYTTPKAFCQLQCNPIHVTFRHVKRGGLCTMGQRYGRYNLNSLGFMSCEKCKMKAKPNQMRLWLTVCLRGLRGMLCMPGARTGWTAGADTWSD